MAVLDLPLQGRTRPLLQMQQNLQHRRQPRLHPLCPALMQTVQQSLAPTAAMAGMLLHGVGDSYTMSSCL